MCWSNSDCPTLAMEENADPEHQMMMEGNVPQTMQIDPRKARFPCCIVWTPLPIISWLVPFIGHIGICREDGVILDFAGPNFVCVDNFAFGSVTRYLQISKEKVCTGFRIWINGFGSSAIIVSTIAAITCVASTGNIACVKFMCTLSLHQTESQLFVKSPAFSVKRLPDPISPWFGELYWKLYKLAACDNCRNGNSVGVAFLVKMLISLFSVHSWIHLCSLIFLWAVWHFSLSFVVQ